MSIRNMLRVGALGFCACALGASNASASRPDGLVGKRSAGPSAATAAYQSRLAKAEKGFRFQRQDKRWRVVGWLSVVEDAGPKGRFVVHTTGGRSVRLSLSGNVEVSGQATSVEQLRTGDVVAFDGTGTAGAMSAATLTVTSRINQPTLAPIESAGDRAVQHRSILVIPVSFPEDRSQYVTPAQLQTAFFSSDPTVRSVRNYFDVSSRGQLLITGAVADWVELSSSRVGCDYEAWSAEAQELLRARGVEGDDYDQVTIVPADASSGTAQACDAAIDRLFWGISWSARDNLTFAPTQSNAAFRTGTAAHEAGHSFGLDHSNALDVCAFDGAPAELGDCVVNDNHGGADVMGGSGFFRPLQGFQRAVLGLLPGSHIQDVSADGIERTLTRESAALGSGKQLFRVRRSSARRPDDQYAYMYLEYRANLAPFDTFEVGGSTLHGVTVGVAGDHRGSGPGPARISASPGYLWFGDASRIAAKQSADVDGNVSLRAGESLYDPVQNVTVSVGAVSPTSAQVTVSPGPPAHARTTATVTAGELHVQGTLADKHRFTVAAAGTDFVISDALTTVTAGSGCAPYGTARVRCSRSAIDRIKITSGNLNDSVYITDRVQIPVVVDPGLGDDAIESRGASTHFIAGAAPDGTDALDVVDRSLWADYSARTTSLTAARNGDGRLVVDGDSFRVSGRFKLTGGTGNDSLSLDNFSDTRIHLDGGPGVDTLSGRGAPGSIVYARDGVSEVALECGSDTVLVRDTSDAPGTGCTGSHVGPQALLTGGPAESAVVDSPGAFAVSSTPGLGVTLNCKIVAGTDPTIGSWAPCPGATYSPVAPSDGVFTVAVRAEQAGAASGAIQSRTFTVDTTAPFVQSWYESSSDVRGSSTVEFTPSESGVSYECSFSGAGYRPCGGQSNLTVAHGSSPQTVLIRAVDLAGNTAVAPLSVEIPPAALKPIVTFTSGPAANATVNKTWATFGFSADPAGATLACSLDGAAFAPCTSPATFSGLANGAHVLSVRAANGASTGPPTTRSFTVAALPGSYSISSAAHTGTVATAGSLSWAHWHTTTPAGYNRNIGQALIETWSPVGTGTTTTAPGPVFFWDNGLGANYDSGAGGGIATTGNGNGWTFNVLGTNDHLRTLKVYVGVLGTSTVGTFRVRRKGSATANSITLAGNSNTVTRVYEVSIPNRATPTNPYLTIEWLQTAGSSAPNQVLLFGAKVMP